MGNGDIGIRKWDTSVATDVVTHVTLGRYRYGILDAGFWMRGSGCGILDAGFWMRDSGCGVLDAGFWMRDAGFWILDAGSIVIISYQIRLICLCMGVWKVGGF